MRSRADSRVRAVVLVPLHFGLLFVGLVLVGLIAVEVVVGVLGHVLSDEPAWSPSSPICVAHNSLVLSTL